MAKGLGGYYFYWLLFNLTMILTSIGGFLDWRYRLQKRRIITDIPTHKILSAPQGYIEIKGRCVDDAGVLEAPLTGKSCTWYKYKVSVLKGTGKDARYVKLRAGTSNEFICMDDNTGKCLLVYKKADFETTHHDLWYGNDLHHPQNSRRRAGIDNRGCNDRNYEFEEYRIHENDNLYAIGLFKTIFRKKDHKDKVNTEFKRLLNEWKNNCDRLLEKYDTNRDGEIDMAEWQKVMDDALEEAMSKFPDHSDKEPVNMLVETKDRNKPFVITNRLEHKLVQDLHKGLAGSLFAFIGGGILAILMTIASIIMITDW